MIYVKLKSNRVNTFTTIALIVSIICALISINPIKVEATVPGYNGEIYFHDNSVGHFELYKMSSNGSSRTQITSGDSNEIEPMLSLHSEKIVFTSDRDGNNEIYTMNTDGSNITRLTNNLASDYLPFWSPDGSKIAFTSLRDGNTEIYVMNSDGSNQINITNHASNDEASYWSPDGTKIAFTSFRNGPRNIYSMNVDGTGLVQILSYADNDANPSWSPDGQKMLFARRVGGVYAIYSMNSDGTNLVKLTDESLNSFHPVFSPDGTKIVFTSIRDGNRQVYLMNPDGSEQTRLTSHLSAVQEFPRWGTIANKAPIASADTLQTLVNTVGNLDVLFNDTDEETLDPANLTIHTQPNHGTASIESGKVKYTPTNNYVGADELTYQICDSFVLDQKCSTAVLSITVKPAALITKIGDKVVENGVEKVVASSNRPTFTGTATPGSTVKVEIHSDPIILTTTADSNGNWSVTPDQDLPPGDHTVYITATLNGVATQLDSFVLAVQQTIPNTGADIWLTRIGGGLVLLIGLGLAWYQRRRMLEVLKFQVPQLFP